MMGRSIILILILSLPIYLFAQQVDSIQFKGLKRCKSDFFDHCIQTKKGDMLDSLKLHSDIKNIKNTDLFVDAKCTVIDSAGKTYVVYQLEEKWTILPSFKGGASDGAFWFQMGMIDFHFLGKGLKLALFYKYFEKSSVFGYVNYPHINESPWGLFLNYELMHTVEPTFNDWNILMNYQQRKRNIELFGSYELAYKHFLYYGFAMEQSRYFEEADQTMSSEFQNKKMLVLKSLHENHLNFKQHNMNGWSNELRVESNLVKYQNRSYWKVLNIYKHFWTLGKRTNIGLRNRIGISEKSSSLFAPFTQDSFENVRGIGNKTKRGIAEFSLNAEFRYSFIDRSSIAVQGVAFSDYSTLAPVGHNYRPIIEGSNDALFYGLGTRIIAKKVSAFIIRLDYSWSAENNNGNLIFGIGQYF